MPVLMGSVHAHILRKPSRAGFALSHLELAEADAETCVFTGPVTQLGHGFVIFKISKTTDG